MRDITLARPVNQLAPVTLIPAALPVTVRPSRKPVGELGSWPCAQVTGEPGLLTTAQETDSVGILREIYQCLRPGGVLSITEVLPDPHYQGLSRVRRLVADSGFHELAIFRECLSYTLNVAKPAQLGTCRGNSPLERCFVCSSFAARSEYAGVECDRDVFMDAAESCRSWATYRYQTVRAAKSSGAGPAWESEVARGLSHCFLRARSKLLTYI